MEEYTRLLGLVPEKGGNVSQKVPEDKKLELRLGPPGEFLSYTNITTTHGAKRVLQDTAETRLVERNWFTDSIEKKCNCSCYEEPVKKCSRVEELQCQDKKASSSPASASFSDSKAETNISNNRVAPTRVVGWPPIRTFRKNLAGSSSSKLASESPHETQKEGRNLKPENGRKDLFIKINMEGIPIGRKINLNAYDSYEKLSVAIDELFRGLLAAQRESSATRNENKVDEAKENGGSVAESGKYTLVYEDNEGDRVLVGDVPWHMFISTAKRLRVLKSSELSTAHVDSSDQQDKTPLSSG